MSDEITVEPLNEAELAWVTQECENARRIVDQYSPSDRDTALTPEVLDRAFKAACAANPQDPDHANAIINAIGIAFGQYLVDQLGLRWAAVTDEHGCELSVVGDLSEGNMVVRPTNLVAKRWVNGTTDFLWYVFRGVSDDWANFQQEDRA
jgi:hypothetical protein